MAQTPAIGRIVHYKLSADDAMKINRRREHARSHMLEHQSEATGVQVHVGNDVRAGECYPMVITRVWGSDQTSAVNGQVLLDGNDLFWVTSTTCGDSERQFQWPTRV